jgi:hypothetical protein
MDTLDSALSYAGYGWSVFPVDPGGKKPLVKWREESTSDPEKVIEMWTIMPNANVGIDTGKSGLVVVDVDDIGAVKELSERFGFDPSADDTAVARTGRGGLHIYYRAGDEEVRNSASKIAAHVDIRGAGGYVVAPPSLHESGQHYEWVRKVAPKPIPEAMVRAFNYREEPRRVELPPERSHEKWGLAILASEAFAVETSKPGERNNQLNKSAFLVYGAVKGGHLDHSIATMRMQQAADHVGLDPEEARKTLDSAWNGAEPRHPTERLDPVPSEGATGSERQTFRLLSPEDLELLPPPEWLLEGRLPEGQTWMYGEPGSGKTFLALDWAASVSAKGMNVIYFVGEGVQGFARRVWAWRQAYGRDISTFRAVPQAPHLLQPKSVEMLRDTVEKFSPALIVIDTFARAAVGGDENSARDVGMAIDVLDGLWREMKVSSLVVHHSTKYQGVERGSSAIRGAADASWEVQAGIDGNFIGGQAVCRKMKDAEPPSPILFRLQTLEDGAYIRPSACHD